MRSNLGFGVVLAVAGLAAAGTAYGQSGATGTGRGAAGGIGRSTGTAPSSLVTAPNNLEQQANEAANSSVGTPATVPGQVAPPPAAGYGTTPPNTYQAPGTAGSVINPAGTTTTYPPNPAVTYPQGTRIVPGTTYSSNYYAPGAQQGVYPATGTAATPGYTGQVMPGMAGYNSVNPMGTTMAPGYYYAGTAGMPYATSPTRGYSSMYVTPGYYNTQPQTYTVQQRRGLFGGMFRRRNRVVYTTSPYGTNYYYGTSPYGYTTAGSNMVTAPGTTYVTTP
jgi:hypothetical protein